MRVNYQASPYNVSQLFNLNVFQNVIEARSKLFLADLTLPNLGYRLYETLFYDIIRLMLKL